MRDHVCRALGHTHLTSKTKVQNMKYENYFVFKIPNLGLVPNQITYNNEVLHHMNYVQNELILY